MFQCLKTSIRTVHLLAHVRLDDLVVALHFFVKVVDLLLALVIILLNVLFFVEEDRE